MAIFIRLLGLSDKSFARGMNKHDPPLFPRSRTRDMRSGARHGMCMYRRSISRAERRSAEPRRWPVDNLRARAPRASPRQLVVALPAARDEEHAHATVHRRGPSQDGC
eukprot:3188362-Prymnesium_polylepis.1